MSRIFEALQKSDSERSQAGFANSPLASEILEAAEREIEEVTPRPVPPISSVPSFQPVQSPAPVVVSAYNSLPLSVPYGSHLVAITAKESLAAEKFRYLGVKLRQMQQTRPLKKILIGSTLPEEGKSMVSANLAATLARRQQQKVLLIEGDLRRPVLAQRMGHIGLDGLSEWLQDGKNPLPEMYQMEGAGFSLIPAGSPPENPLELMQPDRLQAMLTRLGQQFDWIIIDSPPLLPLADATVWARLADGVLMVVREGKSEKKYLQRGLTAIDPKSLLGVVVNSCSNTDHKNYYSRYAVTAGPAV
ncbi:MAG TPA: CpsD/CapB family tyrosine-protein kinase [Terriglobales bacterium]|jgi:capsular exopolysaccharide synthesis family protein|nr:CpsD/CapB family tyrosine-protein kinase [Terriglobales bacterium]